jgi:hypothetical protein
MTEKWLHRIAAEKGITREEAANSMEWKCREITGEEAMEEAYQWYIACQLRMEYLWKRNKKDLEL